MTQEERLRSIMLSSTLGPLAPYFGIVKEQCECGRAPGPYQYADKAGKVINKDHKPGKHPLIPKGWNQDENLLWSAEEIDQWFRDFPYNNYAVVTGVASVGLDIDVRPEKGVDGRIPLAKLEAEAGEKLPPTVTVISGGGGGATHYYFNVPPDVETLRVPKGSSGIEFRWNRQALITPGSLHFVSKGYYRFAPGLAPDEIALADLPEWLLALMRSPTPKSKTPSKYETTGINDLFADLLLQGPPPGSMPPGRLRPDKVVQWKMKKVSMRQYPADRSHSDRFWAWTLARSCSHHWDQYLRLWLASDIRQLPGSKCGGPSYEGSVVTRAFLLQRQQWKSKRTEAPIGTSANPALSKHAKTFKTRMEVPRSTMTQAVLGLHQQKPILTHGEIATQLGTTKNNVKQIKKRYSHLWS